MTSQAAVATCHPRRHHNAGKSYGPTCRRDCYSSATPQLIDCRAPYAANTRNVRVGRVADRTGELETPEDATFSNQVFSQQPSVCSLDNKTNGAAFALFCTRKFSS